MSVCPSVRTENSIPTGRIFLKFDTWVFFENLSRKFVSSKYDKNNGYFTWRPTHIYDNISLSSSLNEKFFRQKLYKKIKTHSLCSVSIFPNTVPFMRKCVKIWHSRIGQKRQYNTAHAGLLRLQTHTRNINTYCFSTARMVNMNAPQCYVYTYFACLVLISMLFFFFLPQKKESSLTIESDLAQSNGWWQLAQQTSNGTAYGVLLLKCWGNSWSYLSLPR